MILGTLITSALALAQPASGPPIRLTRGSNIETEMGSGEVKEATLLLRAGESADIAVVQRGIDVVVDVIGPTGAHLASVDSPNGRQGPEPVSLIARAGGLYRVRIRPIAASEPRGRININVGALRNAAETRRLLAERRRARDAAVEWVARQNAPLPARGMPDAADALPPFDTLAANATIIGLGEATHGSRELNDFRLAMVQRLVTRHGYRLIALEDSASRWRGLEDYVAGRSAAPAALPDWGWIGGRARHALLEWVRGWNIEHAGDAVRIIGVDVQDGAADRARLGAFLARAYGASVEAAWSPYSSELAEAEAQAAVFGDSGTSAALRQFMHEIVAQLTADGPLLRARFGQNEYRDALEAALNLAAFVDFNAGTGVVSHSRDWYMATAIIRAMEQGRTRPKTIYWAHNAHVSAAATRWGPTGALLRQAFGCGYRAVATTFGAGGFIAQVPGDPAARLAGTTLPVAGPDEETVETMLASARPGAHLSAWPCEGQEDLPEWLRVNRPLRWIGALYAPDSPPSASYQPYRLPAAFDAIAYFPTVTAETIPADRPAVPPGSTR